MVRQSTRPASTWVVLGGPPADAAGDFYAFVAVKESGHQDLFVPFVVFLVPSLGFSLASIGLRIWLVKRANLRRTAHLRAPRQRPQRRARIDFRLLCERFVLQRRQRLHDEQKSANDAARYQAYSYVVLALTEVRCTAVCWRPRPVRFHLVAARMCRSAS